MTDDLFSLLAALDQGSATAPQVRERLTALGPGALLGHLKAAGLAADDLPADAEVLAGLVLALNAPEHAAPRTDGPKTSAGLMRGELFAGDPASLRARVAVEREAGVEVLALHAGPEGPRLETDLILGEAPAKPRRRAHVPEEPPALRPPEEPPQQTYTPTPTYQADLHYHYRVDIKLIYWIPYRSNANPLPTRFMPPAWEAAASSMEARFSGRAMLATGNPAPPDGFPTRADFSAFLNTKEFRGVLHQELLVCCPGEHSKTVIPQRADTGFTPATADVPEQPAATLAQRLRAYHEEHQNIGSIATGVAQSPAVSDAMAWYVPGVAISDQYEDALELLKELCPVTNEAYSLGEKIFNQTLSDDCLSGEWEFFVRVGAAHNLLSLALTGKMIAFQGGYLRFKLCCDGKLKLSWRHTAIPSAKLYVNNVKVAEYDMMTAAWSDVEASFFDPEVWYMGSKASAKHELQSGQTKAAIIPPATPYERDLPRRDGCPEPPGDVWLYDGV